MVISTIHYHYFAKSSGSTNRFRHLRVSPSASLLAWWNLVSDCDLVGKYWVQKAVSNDRGEGKDTRPQKISFSWILFYGILREILEKEGGSRRSGRVVSDYPNKVCVG